ncbi:MAG: LysM peptidoglycan-binding domain-containing protein [Patescibacteria group bacterium]
MKNILKNFKFNESTISMILGAIVVVLVAGLMFSYFRSAKTLQPQISDKAASVEIVSADNYVVQPGDCLWTIAEKTTGSGYNWVKIYEANKSVVGNNPDLIYPGQKLILKL